MSAKKMLFIWAASGLWDRIAIIPKLLELQNQWYHVTLLCYEPSYFTLFYNTDEIFALLRDNKLYNEIKRIPRNKFKLLGFMLRNLWKYDEAFTPVNTTASQLRWKLFSKKYSYAFENVNDKDNGKYDNIVEATLNSPVKSLYQYKQFLNLHSDATYKQKFGIPEDKPYMTLFVSIFVRCIPILELEKVLKYIYDQWITIVLLGGEREKWINEKIDMQKYEIVDLAGKTTIAQAMDILSWADFNLSMDGGLMWLGHLMNPYNISIQNISLYLMQPPVDKLHSFNLRSYDYPCCTPCNYFTYEAPDPWVHFIKTCVFYQTDREWECRFPTKAVDIVYIIKKIYTQKAKDERLLW